MNSKAFKQIEHYKSTLMHFAQVDRSAWAALLNFARVLIYMSI